MTREKFNYQDKVVLSIGIGKRGIYIFAEWHEKALGNLIHTNSRCEKNVRISTATDKDIYRKAKKTLQEYAGEIAELYMWGCFNESLKYFSYDNK